MSASPDYVSTSQAEALLDRLQALPGDPEVGFFGPGSITWQVNRESAVFLAAGRAALLQIAHPWVAAALEQHSQLKHDAIGRFHSTFRVIYTMLFGTRAQAVTASRQLFRRHTSIRGELPAALGTSPAHEHYRANETAALRWVYATLVDSALLAYELILRPLTYPEREIYYAESKRMAMLFGLPPEALPLHWNGFSEYMTETLQSGLLAVDANGAALGRSVLAGVGTWVRPPFWYRALTACWLPEPLRAAFELPFEIKGKRTVQRASRSLSLLYPMLPAGVRFVGPYHEAVSRLRGRPPGLTVRRNNRFWMGQDRLIAALPADEAHHRNGVAESTSN